MTITVSRSKKTNSQNKKRGVNEFKYEITALEKMESNSNVHSIPNNGYFIHLTGLKSTLKDSSTSAPNDLTDTVNKTGSLLSHNDPAEPLTVQTDTSYQEVNNWEVNEIIVKDCDGNIMTTNVINGMPGLPLY